MLLTSTTTLSRRLGPRPEPPTCDTLPQLFTFSGMLLHLVENYRGDGRDMDRLRSSSFRSFASDSAPGPPTLPTSSSLPDAVRLGHAIPDDWRSERLAKQNPSLFFRGAKTLTQLAMLYLAGSIAFDLYLKFSGQKPLGATPLQAPPDWMLSSKYLDPTEVTRLEKQRLDEAVAYQRDQKQRKE